MNCMELIEKRRSLWFKTQSMVDDQEFTSSLADYISRPENLHLIQEFKKSPEYLIELFFIIVDKERRTVPFFLNDLQRSFLNDLNKAIKDFDEGKRNSLKFLILKGRQGGFTSFISAYQLSCTITQNNFAGMTIADNGDNTHVIFEDKGKFIYNQLPDFLKPTEKFNNRLEFHFEKLNSRWRVSTAGNKEVGRSKTINFCHCSEAAFYDSINTILTGLGQALTKGSIIILETTANGYNEFEELWTGSEEGINNFEAKFFEWWKTPEYRATFETYDHERKFVKDMELQQKWIFERIHWLYYEVGVSLEQCYWYYLKYRDIEEKIKQEYPCTPREAFLATGACIFNTEILMKRKEEIGKTINYTQGNLSLEYYDSEEIVRFVEDEKGILRIYEFPKFRNPYVIGADVSEGKLNGDFDAAHVIDNLTLKQCAVLHTKIDVDRYATELYKLGLYYNNALLAPEKNFNPGTIINLEKMNYPHLYMRQRTDDISKKIYQEFGWLTNRITRPVMIMDLVEYVRDYAHLINDVETIKEMLTFINDENGKPQAMLGHYDDLVLSLAIAIKASEQGEHSLRELPIDLSKMPEDYREDYLRSNPSQKKYLLKKWGLLKE